MASNYPQKVFISRIKCYQHIKHSLNSVPIQLRNSQTILIIALITLNEDSEYDMSNATVQV